MKLDLRRFLSAPIRSLNWIYVRRPFEPEGQLRRTIDSRAASQSPIDQVFTQEVYGAENKLRADADARDAPLLSTARRYGDAALVVVAAALAVAIVAYAFWDPADPVPAVIAAGVALAVIVIVRRWFR